MQVDKNMNIEDQPNSHEFSQHGARNLVYIREVLAGDVINDLDEVDSQELAAIPADTILYSLHAADGARLALMGDREVAFAAARQNEMIPVNVH
ncbi:MAG: DUF1150 family protein [bacterium]